MFGGALVGERRKSPIFLFPPSLLSSLGPFLFSLTQKMNREERGKRRRGEGMGEKN